jgi:hypothetical protein
MNNLEQGIKSRLGKVFLCAALFRLIFLVWSWTPWLAEPQDGMSLLYFRQGYGLAVGYGYVSSVGEGGRQLKDLYALVEENKTPLTAATAPPLDRHDAWPEMLHPPGMAMLIGGLYRLLHTPVDLAVELVGVLLDSLSAALLCELLTRAWSPALGYATGLCYAFFPPLAFGAAASRTPEGLMAIFVTATVFCVWMALQSGRQRWLWWSLLGGLSLGLGSYFRPDYLLLPIPLGLGAWALTRRFWISVRNLIIVQVTVLLLLLPWAARNHERCGRWIFTSTSVGPTLIDGLGAYHNPWGFGGSDIDRGKEAVAQGLNSAWSPEADVYFRGLFWKSVAQHPLGYGLSVAKKLPLAVAPPLDWGLQNPFKQGTFLEARQNNGQDRYDVLLSKFGQTLLSYSDVLAAGGVCLAALLGWVYLFGRERARWGLGAFLISPYLYALGTHLLTQFEPRYLLPSIGWLLIGLGYLMVRIGERKKQDCQSPAVEHN